MGSRALLRAWLLCAALAGAACGGDEGAGLVGPPTDAVCPEGSTLTYEEFGAPFMEAYCTRCHASSLTGPARHGAPTFHDFDSLPGIRAVDDHIDETAAAGPSATNQAMPPDGARPSLEERQQLGEWIACGAP